MTASLARSTVATMGIAVLGPIEVDGQSNGMGRRDRVVLSALVVRAGDPIGTDALADALWGDDLPASWAKVIHGCIARLRKRLGAAAIESGAVGYRLTLNDDGGGQPALRAALRAGPRGSGRRRPGTGVVPRAGGA